jgi:hypothetical protein
MRKLFLFLLIVAVAGCCSAQTDAAKIDASAVWQPDSSFVAKARAACGDVSPSTKFGDCVIDQMAKAGAPGPAVGFTRELYKQNGGKVGILTGFHAAGPIDIAWITYPLQSDHGLLLVNGSPRIINVEDLKLLDQKSMRQSFQFQDVQNQFPSVSLWPGDRDGRTWPNSQTGPNGGLQFVIGYPLRNGCQTCAHAGFALFGWNFNANGKFTGTTFLGMTPPPITQSGM